MEAAVYWGGHLLRWKQQPESIRAQCVAHFIAKRIREAYEYEKMSKKGKEKTQKPDSGPTDYYAMLKRLGVPL